jgi:membrane associated rhomboid family serine protease
MNFNQGFNNRGSGNPFGPFGPSGGGQRPRSPLSGIGDFFRSGSLLSRLILINIAIFVLSGIVRLFFFLYQVSPMADEQHHLTYIAWFLAVPSDLSALLLRPWTLFTYMFFQENLWHIFFNMLMLYFGGYIFRQYLGPKKLLLTYLAGGVSGAAFYIASYNIFPAFADVLPYSVALGASASVLAIIAGIATYIPNYSVNLFLLGKIKFKYIALIFVAIDILSIEKSNPGGHIAHLGGAFWGFAYVMGLKLMRNAPHPFAFVKKLFRPRMKYQKYSQSRRPMTDDDYSLDKKIQQQKIDAILDKIKLSGYESLSREEKEILFRASNRP